MHVCTHTYTHTHTARTKQHIRSEELFSTVYQMPQSNLQKKQNSLDKKKSERKIRSIRLMILDWIGHIVLLHKESSSNQSPSPQRVIHHTETSSKPKPPPQNPPPHRTLLHTQPSSPQSPPPHKVLLHTHSSCTNMSYMQTYPTKSIVCTLLSSLSH